MPQSLSRVLVHLVFSTKNREPFITAEYRDRVFEYLGGTLNAIKCPVVIVGGMPDHVHLLFVQARTLSLSDVIEEVKKESSKWAKEVVRPDFYWQNGYGAFSVSPSNIEAVTRYIANQEKNHRRRDFKDELRELLRANGDGMGRALPLGLSVLAAFQAATSPTSPTQGVAALALG